MKHIFTSVIVCLLVFWSQQAFAQKVKIKKGQIFIDEVHRGYVESDRRGLGKTKFMFFDLEKDTLFVVGNQRVPSLIDSAGIHYDYPYFRSPKQNRTVYYPYRKGYNFDDNQIVEYLIDQTVLDKEFRVNEKVMTMLLDHGEAVPPKGLQKILDEEKALLGDSYFVTPRLQFNNPKEAPFEKLEISEVKSYTIVENEFYSNRGTVDVHEYAVQMVYTSRVGNKIFETLPLGKVMVKSRTPIGSSISTSDIFVLDTKGTLVAYLGEGNFGIFRVFNGNITQTFMQQEYNKEPNLKLRIRKIVDYLIKTKKM